MTGVLCLIRLTVYRTVTCTYEDDVINLAFSNDMQCQIGSKKDPTLWSSRVKCLFGQEVVL